MRVGVVGSHLFLSAPWSLSHVPGACLLDSTIPFSPNFFIYSSLPPSNIGNGLLCASSISRVTSRRDLDFIFYDALDFPKLSTCSGLRIRKSLGWVESGNYFFVHCPVLIAILPTTIVQRQSGGLLAQ